MVRRLIRSALHAVGLELRHLQQPQQQLEPARVCPTLVEALYWRRGGQAAAFMCPFDSCRTRFGFSYAATGWHPLAAPVEEYIRGEAREFGSSVLRRFYAIWQPGSAAEAVVDFPDGPARLRRWPGYAFTPPWSVVSPEERMRMVARWARRDYAEHGHPNLRIEKHGFTSHGPVSDSKGRFEYERLIGLHRSIVTSGYERTGDDVSVEVLRRGSDFLFIGSNGQHRRAVLKAMGRDRIEAVPAPVMIVDIDDVDSWPHVRSGLWDATTAIRYVDHLFDFDSLAWAVEHGLAPSATSGAGGVEPPKASRG